MAAPLRRAFRSAVSVLVTPARLLPVAGPLMLLDTASLYFRAFYGVPDTRRTADAPPTNAASGLLDMLARLIRNTGRGRGRLLGRRLATPVAWT